MVGNLILLGNMIIVSQIAGSYRGSNFSKGGIVFANWPTSGCCSECCAGCCQGCSGSCLPLGGVRVLSRVLCRGAFQNPQIMFAIGWCEGAVQGAVQGAPDHVCHWAVSGWCAGCCPGCCAAVQGAPDHVCHWAVMVLSRVLHIMFPTGGVRVLSRVLRIMFAIGQSQGAVRVLRIMFPIGQCQGGVLCRRAVQGAPDHVCHWAVSGCC